MANRILPYFGATPLRDVTLSEIKAWRRSLDPKTASSNAAAYRLLRSILQAAEEEELIDRAPPKIRGASNAQVKQVVIPATFDELAVIVDEMPERLKLLIVLAAFVGLRQGELLELRRSDIDGMTGRIKLGAQGRQGREPRGSRRVPWLRAIHQHVETKSGVRTVHVPPPFLPMLQKHLLERTAVGPRGLLLPGDRTDHMSARYLMDRCRPDLTIHHLRHTALTVAAHHGATGAELQARAGQHATLDRDKALAERIGQTCDAWQASRRSP